MITAVQLANKNPTFNLKFTGRPGVRGGAMEIKRVGLEIEGTTEVTPPDLVTQSAAAKVAAGTQQIGTSEKDQATGAEKETRARVYAAEITSRLPGLADTKVRDALKFKANGEFTPGQATKVAAYVAGCRRL